jgi:DNA polymerase III alpha subunit
MKVLPLFTSAYSFRSILTLDKPEKPKEGEVPDTSGADSIIQICQEEKLKHMYLVEDNMVGLLEAKKNAGKDIELRFGLRLTFCADIAQKNDESVKSECKYVIFACSPVGYTLLTQIFTAANVEGYHDGKARMDFKTLKRFWDEKELTLVVPFYDSFIHRNSCYPANCLPDFSFANPVFFLENNGLYFDGQLERAIKEFDKDNTYFKRAVKSIYYKNRKDFLAWQTYKCMQNDSTLRVPNMEDCMSDAFCVEAWKEANV